MVEEALKWAVIERTYIQEELRSFRAGSKMFSPRNIDITPAKIGQLETRLDHANMVIGKLGGERPDKIISKKEVDLSERGARIESPRTA